VISATTAHFTKNINMKTLYKSFLVLISVLVFASCGNKELDEATDKTIEAMTMAADTYDKIADGSLEGDAAIAELKKVGAKMKALQAYVKEHEDVKISKSAEKAAQDKIAPITERMTTSAAKAAASGKLTAEMQQAFAEASL